MSDFVTELRREVVTAHAAHRVAAVRTRRRRRRPLLAGAVALAALLVAVVLIARSLPAPDRSAEPRVVEVVPIGGNPTDGAYAAGSLWVTDYERQQILRIDPARRRVIARVALEDGPDEIRAGGGRVWVSGPFAESSVEGKSRIWSLDPATGALIARFETGYSVGIAPLGDGLWSARRANGPQAIDQLSADGRLIRSIPMVAPNGIAAAGRWVWAVASDGTVSRIEARSGRVDHRWPRLAPANASNASHAIVPDGDGAWVLDASGDRIVRLDGDAVTRVIDVEAADDTPALVRARDGLWVVSRDDARASLLTRLDPRSGEQTATVDLGTHYARALVPTPGGLWAVAGDGTVVLVDS
jgi:hypothetical protein